jgi:cbb3-type cytochrome oxidase maturation protein
MTALAYLVPIALALGGAALAAFLWALKSGQFDDLEGAGWRVLEDDTGPANQAASDSRPAQ